jgi:signal peptidase I
LHDDEIALAAAKRAAKKNQESSLGIWWGALRERFVERNPLRHWWELPQGLPHRYPWMAGMFAFFPGAGQIYNHQWGKAVLLAGSWWVLAAVAWFTIYEPFSNAVLIMLLLALIYIWSDAVTTSNRINGGFWPLRNAVALWFAGLFLAGIVITALQFLLPALLFAAVLGWVAVVKVIHESTPGALRRARWLWVSAAVILTLLLAGVWRSDTQRIFSFVRIIKSSSAPLIEQGDMVLVNNIAYWFARPTLGEIIHFDPAAFRIETGGGTGDAIVVNPQDYFQRVCGLGGDVIEMRDGQILRNGAPMPAGILPIDAGQLPALRYEVPSDHVFAPVIQIPEDLMASLLQNRSSTSLSEGVLIGYIESTMVPYDKIFGRAWGIVNPPGHRGLLRPR